MKLLLDTCVIYPTVMRQMLLGVAEKGVFTPIWSERIIGEWLRAAEKLGPDGIAQAQAEAAMLNARWPQARVAWEPSLESRLWLPDPADIHVLAAAVAGGADVIVTLNTKDFPRKILAELGLSRADPDELLYGMWKAQPELIAEVGDAVLNEANRLSGGDWTIRPLLKKARLPRLAKALAA